MSLIYNIYMKKCSHCLILKDEKEFGYKSDRKNLLNSTCKNCRRIYQRKWYDNNKELHKKRSAICNKRTHELGKKLINEYKISKGCLDCGEKNPIVLDFDHVRGKKEYNIGNMVSRVNVAMIKKEIEKCEVRCANCHRIATYNRRNNCEMV